MQVAAMKPRYVEADEIPAAQLADFDGDSKRAAEELALLEQPFIRDPKRKIRDLVTEAIGKIGENIVVRRFVRYEVGEASDA
jgi:elongation factor Ts